MEYAQITMDEYLGLKKEIQESIIHIAKSFVRIGQTLYKIDQAGAYRLDGYRTLAEFALAEYDINASGVSRFISVYKKYCDGGELKEQYEGYTYAQLVEMLNLPKEDEALIRPDTPRESIRDLKRFNREGEHDIHSLENWQDPGAEDEETRRILGDVLRILFERKDREADFNEICWRIKAGRNHGKTFAALVNPSGNRTVRNGRTMTFLFEDEIRIKVWGKDVPEVCSYGELMECFREVFRDVIRENGNWWKLQFHPDAAAEPAPEPAEGQQESNKEDHAITEKPEIAPAQEAEPTARKEPEEPKETRSPEKSQQEKKENQKKQEQAAPENDPKEPRNDPEEQIPGQDTILNHPELLPDGYQAAAQVDGDPVPAEVELTFAQRKEECLSLISAIQGNVTLEKYGEAYLAAAQLMKNLEVMTKC